MHCIKNIRIFITIFDDNNKKICKYFILDVYMYTLNLYKYKITKIINIY